MLCPTMTNSRVPCINCGSKPRSSFFRPVSEQWPAAIALFNEWLSPYVLNEENDRICNFCSDHAHYKIRQLIKTGQIADETQPVPSSLLSQIENRKVCRLCAKSLNRERRGTSVLWPDGPEKNQLISNLICESVLAPHKKIDADSFVCHGCWRKMIRKLERMPSGSEQNRTEHVISQNNLLQNDEQQNDEPQNDLQEECIELPSYRRSPDISSHCVFENCANQDLQSISEELRATIIKRHHYLVTAQARVCQQHLLRNTWEKLFNAKNSISTFKPDHIEHVLSFVTASKCRDIDFSNILNLDNGTVEYFLGLSKESLSVILKTLPELQGVDNGLFGLMGLLMKHWNGGPISKVAGLLKICPKILETAMMNVLEILRYSPVTVNMGIEYLLKEK